MITVQRSDFRRTIIPDDYFPTDLGGCRLPDSGEFVGVKAAVDVPIPFGHNQIIHRIESPGLWGIEVGANDEAYLDQVFQEESNILAGMLTELGIEVTL